MLSLLAIPLFMMAPKELAPTEDQGFVMGIVEAAADATIDQTTFYTEAVNRELMSVPEAAQTFQITFPDNGFSGLVLKPWGERKRTVFQIVPEVQQKVSRIPGIRTFVATPPALPGGGQFPVEFVIGATAEPEVDPEVRRSSCSRRPRPAACSPSRRSSTPRSTSPKWSW